MENSMSYGEFVEKVQGTQSVIKNVVFFDIETSELNGRLNTNNLRNSPEIIEIGAIKVESDEMLKFNILVKPNKKVPLKTLRLCTDLKEEDFNEAPNIMEVREKFKEFIGDYPLICHDAKLKYDFFKVYIDENISRDRFIDSMETVSIIKPCLESYDLDYLILNYLKENRHERNRAYDDALDILRITNKLVSETKSDFASIFEITSLIGEEQCPWIKWLIS